MRDQVAVAFTFLPIVQFLGRTIRNALRFPVSGVGRQTCAVTVRTPVHTRWDRNHSRTEHSSTHLGIPLCSS